MGLRFRRSIGFGPFRLTATKSGLSGSVGVPGARVSVNSKGQVRRTVGIPGSGIYDTELVRTGASSPQTVWDSSEVREVAEPVARRRWGAGTTFLFLVMAIVIIGQAIALSSR